MSESRQPQVGDFVAVGFDGKIYQTKITRIDRVVLYLNDINSGVESAIYWINGWYLANGVKAESVTFRKGITSEEAPSTVTTGETPMVEGLTGNQLADLNILTLADDSTFRNICATNRKLHILCTDPKYQNELYSERIKLHMPEFISLIDTNNSWKKVYDKVLEMRLRLMGPQSRLIRSLVQHNDLLGLKILDIETYFMDVVGSISLADVYGHGSLDILKWLLENGRPLDPYRLLHSVATGKVNMIDFMYKMANSVTPSLNQPNTETEPNISAYLTEIEKRTGHDLDNEITAAREIFSELSINNTIRNAATHGQIPVLDWYLRNRRTDLLNASRDMTNDAALTSYPDQTIAVFEWMKANQVPINTMIAGGAVAAFSTVSVLDWLEKEGYFGGEERKSIIQSIANTAADHSKLETFKWAVERGARLAPSHYDVPIYKFDLPFMKYLHSKGIRTENILKRLQARTGYIGSLDKINEVWAWLREVGYT